MISSLGSINWLEWFTELRAMIYLLSASLLEKDMEKDTESHPDGGDARGEVYREGQNLQELAELAPLPAHPRVLSPRSSSHPVLGDFYGGFIMSAGGIISSISNPSPLSGDLARGRGVGGGRG